MEHPVVRKLECYYALSAKDKALVIDVAAKTISVPAQQDLIREGDEPSVVHLVISGFACRYKRLADGSRQIVAFLIPGDLADPFVFISKVMDHSITTLAPSKVVSIPKQSMLAMLERPTLGKAFFLAALADSAILREWITTIGQRSAPQRLAHILCELYFRFDAIGLVSDGSARFPLSQMELGDAVGLSLVHTNKSLQKLRQLDAVRLGNGNIEVVNCKALKEFCGFRSNYLHHVK